MKALRNVWAIFAVAVVAALTLGAWSAGAEDKKDAKDAAASVTGTWKWSFTGQDGTARETTAKLKQDGEKLTGTITGRNNTETEISEGKIKGSDISFKVVRKINDRELVSAYEGKLEGDVIKGKIATTGGNQDRTRDWEAKREKEAAK